jgi:hypothetical protein
MQQVGRQAGRQTDRQRHADTLENIKVQNTLNWRAKIEIKWRIDE